MKFYQVLPAAPGFVYTKNASSRESWDYDILAWGFEHGSALPIPITAEGPQTRRDAQIRNMDRENSHVDL